MKERIITATCLLAIVLPLIFLGGYWFVGLGFIATVIAVWEMVNLSDHSNKTFTLMKCLIMTFTVRIVFIPDTMWALRGIVAYILLIFLIEVCLGNLKKGNMKLYAVTIFYIGLSFRALLEVRNHSLTLFILLVATVILTDSAAYFTGRFFGKNKLAPKISPNKTIEGAVGGWLIGGGFAFVFGLMNNLFTETWILIVLAIGLPILSQIGDLIASGLKRKYGVKDYGKIFPGHGGVMDRVDSQMLAGILMYVIILMGGVL